MLLLTACLEDELAQRPAKPDSAFGMAVADAEDGAAPLGRASEPVRAASRSALFDFSPLPAAGVVSAAAADDDVGAEELPGEAEPAQLAQATPPMRAPVTVLRTQPGPTPAMPVVELENAPTRTTTIRLGEAPAFAPVEPPPPMTPAPKLQARPTVPVGPMTPAPTAPKPPAPLTPTPEVLELATPVTPPAPVDAPAETKQAADMPKTTPMMAPAQPKPGPTLADLAENYAWRVQVASLGTADAARSEWTRLQGRFEDLLEAQSLNIEQAQLDNGTFFRVQTGKLNDRVAAEALCGQLKSRGQDCLVVRGPAGG